MPADLSLSVAKQVKLYPYDVDYMAVVHNVVYLRWMEEMRTDMMEEHYSMAESIEKGITPVISEVSANYKIPLRIGDKATARIFLKEMGKIKWVVGFEITSEAGLHFSAEQTGYFYNIKLNRPSRTPKHLIELFFKQATA